MKYRLPMRSERCVKDAEAHRAGLATNFSRAVRVEGDVSCTKGCHHCCYNPLLITILEGISLFRWLSENRLWTSTLKDKFQQHREQTTGLSVPVWLLSQIPCPLLDEEKGICRAYEGRPMACRITYSTGDPHYCHPHRVGDAAKIVPRRGALEARDRHEKAVLKHLRTPLVHMPLAEAVLLGERISKGDISIEDYPSEAAVYHLENG